MPNNQELINYIKENLNKGFAKEQIIEALKVVGWQDKDVADGFQELENPIPKRNFSPRHFIIVGVIIIFLAGGFFAWQYFGMPKKEAAETNTPAETALKTEIVKPVDKAWEAFQSILAAVRERDLNKMNSFSYEQYSLDDCEDLGVSTDECWELTGSVYAEGEKFQKTDFRNIVENEKQILMSTDLIPVPNEKTFLRTQLYFVKTSNGDIKLVVVSGQYFGKVVTEASGIGSSYKEETKTVGPTPEEIKDADSDGLTDEKENCAGVNQYNKDCIKTNQNLRDTDGDGWWDSTEEKAETNPNDAKSVLVFK